MIQAGLLRYLCMGQDLFVLPTAFEPDTHRSDHMIHISYISPMRLSPYVICCNLVPGTSTSSMWSTSTGTCTVQMSKCRQSTCTTGSTTNSKKYWSLVTRHSHLAYRILVTCTVTPSLGIYSELRVLNFPSVSTRLPSDFRLQTPNYSYILIPSSLYFYFLPLTCIFCSLVLAGIFPTANCVTLNRCCSSRRNSVFTMAIVSI